MTACFSITHLIELELLNWKHVKARPLFNEFRYVFFNIKIILS